MKPETVTIRTERLILEEVTPELHEYIMNNWSDDQILEYYDWSEADLTKGKKRLPRGTSSYYASSKFFLLRDKINNQTIGTCGFYRWYPEHDRGEIGYVMSNESYRKKGLMQEAAKRILQYGFEDMGLHRIEAFAHPDNTSSVNILGALGMKYEGLLREHFKSKTNGVHEDSACYSILKHEYEKAQP